MHLAEIGMLLAIIGTLVNREIVSYEWILAGLFIGSRDWGAHGAHGANDGHAATDGFVARFWRFGRFSGRYFRVLLARRRPGPIKMPALSFEVLLGSLTTTGSLIACAKLQGVLPGAPLTYKGQNIFNLALLAITVLCFVLLLVFPGPR